MAGRLAAGDPLDPARCGVGALLQRLTIDATGSEELLAPGGPAGFRDESGHRQTKLRAHQSGHELLVDVHHGPNLPEPLATIQADNGR